MHTARIVKFSEVKVGDIVCKQLGDVRPGFTYKVLEIGASEDRKDKLVQLQLQPPDQSWPPHWYNSEPDDLIVLVRRPRPEGITEGAAMMRVVEDAGWLVTIVGDIGRPRSIPDHITELGEAIALYELGKDEK